MSKRRKGAWLVTAAVFGTIVLPALVYFTGLETLGSYSGGGLGAFYRDFLADLARLRWHAWALAVGPLALVTGWHLLARPDRGAETG
jgi:hypothetical protein